MSPRPTRLVGGVIAAALAGLAWLAGTDRAPAGVPAELVQPALQLRTRETLYHRTVGRLVMERAPTLAARFPRLLGVRSQASLRRLEACHQLVALGPKALPALPLLVDAFCDREHDVRLYAFLSLAHVEAPAAQVASLIQARSRDPSIQTLHCARLLGDEDDRLRDFAWALLDRLGARDQATVTVLDGLAGQTYDARLARRAAALLPENPRISD